MRIGPGRQSHLTYCLNIHPGERWQDQRTAIEKWSTAVKARVSPDGPFGLGLRLGKAAADDLRDPFARRDVRDWLNSLGMYAFTVNAFPYGAFHGAAVKSGVYAPDWRAPGRLAYTTSVAAILADLLPDGVAGSISTVPGSYRAWIERDGGEQEIVRSLAEAAWALDGIERRTGRKIALALEPEPDCFLSTAGDCIRFWNGALIPCGTVFLRERAGSAARAETCLRRFLGVCVDACHFAVEFESPAEAVESLSRAGIAIPKVQVSAALRGPATPDVARRLGAFVDRVYLHQTRLRRSDGSVDRWPDLTAERLESIRADRGIEVRSHFHVPLHFGSDGELASTAGDLTARFFSAVSAAGCGHVEIETYTYDVLPAGMRAATVAESVVREYEVLLGMVPAEWRN